MARYITVSLESRGVTCVARLLDDEAPRTSEAIWDALPLSGQVVHGKYARNEIYTLVAPFAAVEPGKENTTVTPIPGDLCYFAFTGNDLLTPGHGYEEGVAPANTEDIIIDLPFFYGRNNLLLNGDAGWVPGNVYGTVVENLDEMAKACQDLWMGGARGETLTYARR